MNEEKKHLNIQGYSEIELIVIIGVFATLALIALPSILSQANKAKQSEAKTNIGSMNRAHQAYFLDNKEPEEKGKFANEFGKLELDIPTETENYQYLLRATDSATFHYAIAKERELKSYVGAVFMVETASEGTLAISCEAAEPGLIPAEPQMENGVPTCGAGTEEL
ncbi:MAG: type IV pilin-like G/H family protein [Hormoscilla sp.]